MEREELDLQGVTSPVSKVKASATTDPIGTTGKALLNPHKACGCQEGLVFGLIGLGCYLGWALFSLRDPFHSILAGVGGALVAFFVGAVVGKTAGLARAHRKQRRLL